MIKVLFVNGHWFAYLETRVLEPFKSEKQAWKEVRQELAYDSWYND